MFRRITFKFENDIYLTISQYSNGNVIVYKHNDKCPKQYFKLEHSTYNDMVKCCECNGGQKVSEYIES